MMIRPCVRYSLLAVSLAIVLPSVSAAQARQYDAFFAFGDSLVDTGNVFIATADRGFDPPIPPSTSPHRSYFLGRFSNGPVAFEYLWLLVARHGLLPRLVPSLAQPSVPERGGVSYAFAGSGTSDVDPAPGGFLVPGLKGQVDVFRAGLGGRPAPPRALYTILAGANDYLRDAPLDPAQSVANIAQAIDALHALGARDVLVLNLPDLGTIPLVAGTPQAPALSALSRAHNTLLAARLQEIASSLPGIRLIPIDVDVVLRTLPPGMNRTLPALDALLPAAPGELPASRCIFIDPATCRDVPRFFVGLRHLFWDAEHPTTAVHLLLALHLYAQLVGVGLDTSLTTRDVAPLLELAGVR